MNREIKLSKAAQNAINNDEDKRLLYLLAAEMGGVDPRTVKKRAKDGYQYWDHGNYISIIAKETGLVREKIIIKSK